MDIGEALDKLDDQIAKLSPKKQEILSSWISVWADYLKFESSFDPERLMEYRRGDIIHAHLGVNVGNEEGGARYAVVVDKNNPKTSKVITVIPLSTLDEKKGRDDLRSTDVYLGKTIPGSDLEAYALTHCIRSISKIRIIRPKNVSQGVYRLSDEQMYAIDAKMKELFF